MKLLLETWEENYYTDDHYVCNDVHSITHEIYIKDLVLYHDRICTRYDVNEDKWGEPQVESKVIGELYNYMNK